LREGYVPAGVVDDLLDHPADVAVALCKVEVAETGGVLVMVGVRLELDIGRGGGGEFTVQKVMRDDVRWRASAFVS